MPKYQVNSRKYLSNRAFTLQEMMVIAVIIGVLATLGYAQYGGMKEKALEKEAEANVKLILTAEEVFRMEETDGEYYPSCADTECINNKLRTFIPELGNWNYEINDVTGKVTATRGSKKCYMRPGDKTLNCD